MDIRRNDIVKISKGDYTTLAKVVATTGSDVLVFRDTGNVWYSFDEYDIEPLELTH